MTPVLNPVSGHLTSRQLAGTPNTVTRRKMPRSTSSASQPHVLVTPPPIPPTDTDRTNYPSRSQQTFIETERETYIAMAPRDVVLLLARPSRAA